MSSVRQFETGATRSPLENKLQYEGFFSPLVLRRRAQYMHKHRYQSDGNVREADNWQKGMPLNSYMDSGFRHFMDWWLHHRGFDNKTEEPIEEALCALMFNAEGYLHEILKCKNELLTQSIPQYINGQRHLTETAGASMGSVRF